MTRLLTLKERIRAWLWPDEWHPPGPIHPMRWRFLAIWIVIFTGIVFVMVRTNRSAISDLHHTKADVGSLKVTTKRLKATNCALREFLHTAAATRRKLAKRDTTTKTRMIDLQAAKQYDFLATTFDGHNCPRSN